jgi:hypothetical protein
MRERPLLAEKRLIGLSIPDTQHENPRGVRKGRLLTHQRHTRRSKPVSQKAISGQALSPHGLLANLRWRRRTDYSSGTVETSEQQVRG